MAKAKPTAKFETITPAVAKQLLGKNTNNRNMSEKTVAHYVRQLQDGAWTVNGETIKIAADGTLLDGQHRLHAIIESGKPFDCLIVRGLSKDVMSTIDTGRGRTVADHLKLQNRFHVSSYTATGAAIGIVFRFKKGKYIDGRERMTPAEAIAFLEQNPGFLKSTVLCNHVTLVRLLTPSVLIATHYMFCKINRFKAESFFEKLASGENLGATSPILQLRTQLFAMKSNTKRNGAAHKRKFLYYIVAAFSAYLENRRVDGTFKFTENSLIELPKAR